jgi:hypothetical protein
MISGVIMRAAGPILVRALGPSLESLGIPGALQDPSVELIDANGTSIGVNDNWKQSQPAEIQQTGLAPADDREAAVLANVSVGNYTAVLRGARNTTGIGLLQYYCLPNSEGPF